VAVSGLAEFWPPSLLIERGDEQAKQLRAFSGGVMSARAGPTFANEGGRADVAPASAYKANQPVWVNRHGWRPGVALFGSERAVSVRYRQNVGLGTCVDTVLPIDLALRTEPDPYLDRGRFEAGATTGAVCDG